LTYFAESEKRPVSESEAPSLIGSAARSKRPRQERALAPIAVHGEAQKLAA
jgi:hypothetical protein